MPKLVTKYESQPFTAELTSYKSKVKFMLFPPYFNLR